MVIGVFLLITPNEDDVGGAPVINLNVVPLAQFDGLGTSQESEPAGASGSQGETAPEEVTQAPAATPAPIEPALTAEELPTTAETGPTIAPEPATSAPRSASGENGPMQGDGEGAVSTSSTTAGGGARTLGARAAPDEDVYAATVLAWVESHKGRPRASQRGDVVVRFVLDRRGRLRNIDLIGSSGSRTLDRLALEALEAAQPFPLPPSGSDWRTREFRVRLRYAPLPG